MFPEWNNNAECVMYALFFNRQAVKPVEKRDSGRLKIVDTSLRKRQRNESYYLRLFIDSFSHHLQFAAIMGCLN